MARIITVVGFAAAALLCGAADPSPVSAAFGNTIVATYPDGRTGELWLAPDGSYTGEGRSHNPTRGHWKIKGAKLCLKQSRPFPAPFGFCAPLPSGGLDAEWSGKAPTGEMTQIRLVQGHVPG